MNQVLGFLRTVCVMGLGEEGGVVFGRHCVINQGILVMVGATVMTLRLVVSFMEAFLMPLATQEDKGYFQAHQPSSYKGRSGLVGSPAPFYLSPTSSVLTTDPHIRTALVECKEIAFSGTRDAEFIFLLLP